ncbi:class GN sortase [Marinobacter xestospongiae]|uniref:class GN sortase n=1 Tax=Marinobacter xestospongiae TaxID=994319 RepID=UPI0020036381|nr:class GN sortase [Marinobacter xestospongiae]MCK7568660.1 class GN sortase [Marinobacter xestospongiae]
MSGRWLTVVALASLMLVVAGLWIPAKAMLAQELLEMAWSESRARQTDAKPWPWADTWPVARLALPDEDLSWIVLDGVHGESLAFGPGLVRTGDHGPVMIAGHRDTHFRALEAMAAGTRLQLQQRDGQWQDYQVASIRIVDSRQEGVDLNALGPDGLLLVTCYPFDSLNTNGPLRYVVEAQRVTTAVPEVASVAHAVTDS